MLLRFSVSNFRSIRDKAELSLVASSLKGGNNSVFTLENQNILASALIFGSNASGKSNLIAAMNFMLGAIRASHATPAGGKIPRHKFRLGNDQNESSYEIDFLLNSTRYHYGFTCDDSNFTGEWLYYYPNGKPVKLLERSGSASSTISIGKALRGHNKVMADITRPDSLFVSAAIQNNHHQITEIFEFRKKVFFSDDIHVPWMHLAHKFGKRSIDKRVISFLSEIDTGIIDYRLKKTVLEKPERLNEFSKRLSLLVKEYEADIQFEQHEIVDQLQLGHQSKDGKSVYFNLSDESDGTLRMVDLLHSAFQVMDAGGLLVVDELDASLHTLACKKFLELFSSKANVGLGQLIATTHDTNLLASKDIRRDQIWLCEKDQSGASRLYSLAEVRSREGDNFERGYLQGRYGAVPGLGI